MYRHSIPSIRNFASPRLLKWRPVLISNEHCSFWFETIEKSLAEYWCWGKVERKLGDDWEIADFTQYLSKCTTSKETTILDSFYSQQCSFKSNVIINFLLLAAPMKNGFVSHAYEPAGGYCRTQRSPWIRPVWLLFGLQGLYIFCGGCVSASQLRGCPHLRQNLMSLPIRVRGADVHTESHTHTHTPIKASSAHCLFCLLIQHFKPTLLTLFEQKHTCRQLSSAHR